MRFGSKKCVHPNTGGRLRNVLEETLDRSILDVLTKPVTLEGMSQWAKVDSHPGTGGGTTKKEVESALKLT
jgi:hypothetical protein